MIKLLKNQRGVSILFAVFMLLVLGMIMVALVGLLSTSETSSAEELLSTQTLFLAETGIEIAITENLAAGIHGPYSYRNGPNGNIQVVVSSLGTLDGLQILQVDSTGTIGDIRRRVRVKYRP
jgi:hypothetical protein